MTQPQLTPWTQLDDELGGQDGAGLSPPAEADVEASGESRCRGVGAGTASSHRRRLPNVAPHWAIVPLTAAAVWLACVVVFAARAGTGLPTLHALGILVLILAGGGMVLIAHSARKAAIARVHRAISQNPSQAVLAFAELPISAELRPLLQAVERHAANVESEVASLLDQHKQVALELSLANTRKRQGQAVIDAIADPVLVTDAFDQLTLANPAAAAVFGLDGAVAQRQPIDALIGDEALIGMIRQAREADSRVASRRTEHQIGSRAYVITISPLASASRSDDSSPENHGLVVLLRDITKEQEATKMKSEFVARAAHELRTPLSSIRAYVEMLVDGEAADEKTREEYYNIIQTSADRLGRMIDNVLNISRIEAGTVRISKEPVAVSMIVKEAIDVARPQAEEKQIALAEDLTPVAFRVMADRDMIYQAVLNLLSNAIKYTQNDGKVHVKMTPHEENHTIHIEVSDTGAGIPKEDLPRMFEKFFRVEANKKMAKGTGLGLNLVKNIVETIHGGKMTLTSEVGKGSTFGIVLPLMS